MTVAAAVADPPRTIHVEHCMGTVFSLDIRDPGSWADPIAEAVAWLRHVEDVFSTYQPASTISRIRVGDLTVEQADEEVIGVLALCTELNEATGGHFDAGYDGRPDPTGLVKGWAIERASQILREHGSPNHAINGGGDIQLAGSAAPGRPWRTGIADPHDRGRVLTVVTGTDLAVATSGTAERGEHIICPHTGRPAAALTSVTVTGPSLTYADAYATAAFSMGSSCIGWMETLAGYQAMTVAPDRRATFTSGFPT